MSAKDAIPPESLIELSRTLGDPEAGLAILAEGNTSKRDGADQFWVKASGNSLCGIGPDGFVRVRSEPLLAALDGPELSDEAVRTLLSSSVECGPEGLLPSVEAFMHAFLLTLPGVEVVGHTHPPSLLSLLCLDQARDLADKRIFPDEIVCCGPAACWVDYHDPGLPLAKELRKAARGFDERFGAPPKTIWLQNHGLIALGASESEVLAATRMQVKAASVLLAALQTGAGVRFLTAEEIERIHTRPDEHYRQRFLWGAPETAPD